MNPTDLSATKRALRQSTLERLLALDLDARSAQSEELQARFATLPGLRDARTVLLYATAFADELDTRPLLRLVREGGQALVLPRVNRRRRALDLFRVDDPDADLVSGHRAIPEPRKTCPAVEPDRVDWVLVPGLAFDRRCQRLGRGAGHYDRLLPTLRGDAMRWALIYEEQWVREIPVEPHDIPLDGVASPSMTVTRA